VKSDRIEFFVRITQEYIKIASTR